MTGLRWYPLEALEAAEGVRSPLRLNFGGATRGDSGRGREGRRKLGRGTAGLGPIDLLKFAVELREGVVGTANVEDAERRLMYLLLFIGTKIPDPGTEVVKYLRPSTSPLFLPRAECSLLNSIPANLPGLPATAPKYFTVPCIPPGTLTTSPTCTSSRGAMVMRGCSVETFGKIGRRKKRSCRNRRGVMRCVQELNLGSWPNYEVARLRLELDTQRPEKRKSKGYMYRTGEANTYKSFTDLKDHRSGN